MQVVDGGGRRSQNIGQINIIVQRNEGPPQYTDYQQGSVTFTYPYSNTILYTAALDSTVLNVLAIDNDVFGTVRYRLRTDALTDRYFDIDPISGAIFLRANLSNAEVAARTQFNVGIFCLYKVYRIIYLFCMKVWSLLHFFSYYKP